MNQTFEDPFLQLAVRHKLLSPQQAIAILKECVTSDTSAKEIAIRKGFMNGRKFDILQALESPNDVAPGYRVESVIGTGGFGVVYKATQVNLDRTVALKTIAIAQFRNTTAPQRFKQEAKIVGQLRHPNIVTAVDFGLHNDRLFLSMEYVQGVGAELFLKHHGRLSEYSTWHVIRQVTMALAYAVGKGVIHRDIKPGNLMLTDPPVGYELPPNVPIVKVTDFGLACFNENREHENRITIADTTVGTPYYVSPEQSQGKDVDERSDIYSIGITAWQLLAGEPPMFQDSPMKVFGSKMHDDATWLQQMPREWSAETSALILKLCAFEPANRVSSHSELIKMIDSVLKSLPDNSDSHTDFVLNEAQLRNYKPLRDIESLKPIEANIDGVDSNHPTQLDVTIEDVGQKTTLNRTSEIDFESPSLAHSANRKHIASKSKSDQRSILKLVLTWVGVLAVTAGMFFGVRSFLSNSADPLSQANEQRFDEQKRSALTELAYVPVYFFNGTDIDPTQRFTGNWDVSKDSEQGIVLSGLGTRIFKCRNLQAQPVHYFQFRMGFMHHEADDIKINLHTESSNQLGQILITQQTAVLFDCQSDAPVQIGTPVEVKDYGERSLGYHRISIERNIGFWNVHLDGVLLGNIDVSEYSPASIEIVVGGNGYAHFEQIRMFEFVDPKSED